MFFPTYFILTALQQEEGTPRRREARRGAEAALRRRLWRRPQPEPRPLRGKLVGQLRLQVQPRQGDVRSGQENLI